MRIVLPFVAAPRHISGVQRHAVSVARSLLLSPEIVELRVIVSPWQDHLAQMLPADERVKVIRADVGETALSRNRWYYAVLPGFCENADVVHLSYPAPVKRAAFGCCVVTSLHDMYPYDLPQNFGVLKGYFNRSVLRFCLRAVDAIACVSRSTWKRLEQVEPRIAHAKASVISNAVEPAPLNATETVRPYAEPFFLCVAQHRRNKQIPLMLEVFSRLLLTRAVSPDTKLIVVGIPGPETTVIRECIRRHSLTSHVHTVTGLTEGQLQALYLHCEVLVAPSSMEGFGLPVVEGILAGCRVVCSDIAAFREVGNSSCSYVRLSEDAVCEFASAITEYLGRPKPRAFAMPEMSLSAISAQYLRLYRDLVRTGLRRDASVAIASSNNVKKEVEV